MFFEKRASAWIARLERFTDRIWYFPIAALLAAADIFVVFIPVDGLVVTSAMLQKRRWLQIALVITTGSALGALAVGWIVSTWGEAMISGLLGSPDLAWPSIRDFVQMYGAVALVLLAVGPFPVQPGVVVAAAADMPLFKLFIAVWIGRAVKYVLFAWLATHAPNWIGRLWRVRDEVKEISDAETT